jgi:hypothetical protein
MGPRAFVVLAALGAGSVALAEEAPKRPQFVLAPSATAAEPTGPMSGVRLLEDLDRPSDSPGAPKGGHWVVAPLPFRNELLGVGLVVGAGYLYGAKESDANARHSVAGAAGMYAEGGSWAALAAHRGYWSEQRYRTTAAVATGELLYNVELELGANSSRLRLQQEFSGVMLQGAVRIGEHGWLGGGLIRGETEVRIANLPQLPAEFSPDPIIAISNLALNGEYDTRDNDLNARSGHYGQAEILAAREDIGSDSDYNSLELEWNTYRSFGEDRVLALRVAGKLVDGDPPFFALAWFGTGVDLRGYTPGRYIGESMFAAQAEWRWQATPRWGLVAFGGAGKVSGALGDIDTDEWLPAGGFGVRFRLVKALPLNMRADFAWGRDDYTFSLAVGEAF